MATSGTYVDNPTNLQTISAALRKINRLGDFETLSTSDPRYTSALAALKLLCKSYAAYGMPLWAILEYRIPMSMFTSSLGITIGLTGGRVGFNYAAIAPLKVYQAYRNDSSSDIDVPMQVYTNNYYNTLSNKEITGCPVGYTYYSIGPAQIINPAGEPQQGYLKIWPLPDTYWAANGYVVIRHQRPFQDVGAETKELDFPQEWMRAVTYALAYDLAPEYGVDQTQRQMLRQDRDLLLEQALGFGTEEGDYNIQPRIRW